RNSSRPPSRSPEKYGGMGGPQILGEITDPVIPGSARTRPDIRSRPVDTGVLDQMQFNVRSMPMSPRLHHPPSPRSRDKFMNLPQFNGDVHYHRVIEEDMRPERGQ
ncbi:unnamed protein product, partial [Amoebophrya sp. A25]